MIYGLYHSAAGMLTTEYAQNVTANNLANADTTGFKRAIATFAEREPASLAGVRNGKSDPSLAGISGGLWLGKTITDYRTGGMEKTGVDTDVALEGAGFFTVQKDGETLLTRDGRFVVDSEGALRSATDGAPVLDPNGAPIRTMRYGGPLTVDSEGRIFQNDALISRLGVTDVSDYEALQPRGAGRYAFDPEQELEAFARVRHEFIERSGVEPMTEMVNMIQNSRAYQMNAQMIGLQDQSLGRLISVAS